MASFSEQTLAKKLNDLNSTQQSIQTLSLWLIHHRKRSKMIVDLWYKELKKVKEPRKLQNLMYLANDVIQNSKKKGPEFSTDFGGALVNAFGHIARHTDGKTLQAARRVIDVWRDRGIYDQTLIDGIMYAVTSNLTNQQVAEFESAGSGPSGVTQKPPVSPLAEKSSNGAERSTQRSSSAPKSPVLDTNREPPPNTEELIAAIKQLDGAASADAVVRSQIAALPPEVADIKRLDLLTTKEQVERLSKVVADADKLLTDYNARLSAELDHRKQMLKKLKAYLQHQREKAEEDERDLTQWKEKLAKLGKQRQELKAHIESLPDLSKLPSSAKLPSLPSAGELFS